MNRAARRKQLKDDEKLVARGLDVVSSNGYEVIAMMRVLHERLREAQKARSVRPLIEFLHANVEQAALRVTHIPVACGKGCSHCCHLPVSVLAPEAIHVVKTLGPRRAVAEAALQQSLTQVRGVSLEQRGAMVTPCPLLDDGNCSVYRNRPLTCRTAASGDADICRRAYTQLSGEGVPVPKVFNQMRLGYSLALTGAMRQAGLSFTAYEYNCALERVMARPDAEAAWLSGEDILAGLPGNAADPFQVPQNRALYDAAFG